MFTEVKKWLIVNVIINQSALGVTQQKALQK